jgi:uncharacterized membrane protein YGL010W
MMTFSYMRDSFFDIYYSNTKNTVLSQTHIPVLHFDTAMIHKFNVFGS